MDIYVDADACPVKDEALRVAERHSLVVHMVSNSYMRLADSPLIRRVVVADGPDAADDWIVERLAAGDIVVTADIPLAARAVKKGAQALAPNGRAFSEASIGMTLAVRDLMANLRETGDVKSHNPAFTRRDRSQFLQTLEDIIQALKRSARSS